MAFNNYETLFIVDVTAGEEAAKATVDKFTTLISENGEIIDIANWGKKRLAYLINDMSEGVYTVVTYKADPSFISELERLMNIDESVMRSLTLKLEHEPTFKAEVEAEVANEEVVAEETVAEVETTDAE